MPLGSFSSFVYGKELPQAGGGALVYASSGFSDGALYFSALFDLFLLFLLSLLSSLSLLSLFSLQCMERNITARDIMSVEAFENAATMVYVCIAMCWLYSFPTISSTDQNMKILRMLESFMLESFMLESLSFLRACILIVW